MIFDFSGVVSLEFLTTKEPSSIFSEKLRLRRLAWFLVGLCLCKITSPKLDTPTLVSIIPSKSCLINTYPYDYCPLLWMFYGRVLDISLSVKE